MPDKMIDPEQLWEIREKYEELRARNGADTVHNPDALAALSLVERLLEDADGWAEQWIEDVAFFGGSDPDDCEVVIPEHGEVDVSSLLEYAPAGGLARRQVRAYRWRILEEPGGEDE